jgi:hypothetical protein
MVTITSPDSAVYQIPGHETDKWYRVESQLGHIGDGLGYTARQRVQMAHKYTSLPES